jgi:hypothetical protein
MKLFLLFLLFATMSTITRCTGAKREITSIYTDLSGNQCKTVKENAETGSSVQECPGVAGFRLLVADDDARMSVSVVTPDKKEHALDYWNIITRSFSSLGDRAEWRVVKRKGMITPIALIVRVDSSEQENIEARTRLRELRWSRFTRVHSLRPTSAFQQLR